MTNRWILGDVLGNTAGSTNRVAELVAEDTGGFSGRAVGACAAGKLERVVFVVFFRVEHVGAGACQ